MTSTSQAMAHTAKVVQNSASRTKPHWQADFYKKNSVRLQQTQSLNLLDKLTFKDDARILDVGCGDGKITAALARRLPKACITAFDFSEDMIAVAKRDHAALQNITFSVADAAAFDVPCHDAALSFFCLQWVADKAAALRCIGGALQHGGTFAAIMTDRNPHLLSTRRQLAQTPLWAAHFETYQDATKVIDDDAYVTYAEQAGLKVTSYDERLHTLAFDSEAELAAFVRMVTPALQHLPNAALKESYFQELFAGYKKALPPKEGVAWYIEYTLKTLQAVKP